MTRSDLLEPGIMALAARVARAGGDAQGDEPGGARSEALDDAAARAVWSCLVEPGDGIAGLLVGAVGAPEALRHAIGSRRPDAVELTARQWHEAVARWRPRMLAGPVRTALECTLRAGVRMLTPFDARWPVRSDDLGPHAPLCLWVRGDPAVLASAEPAVAIVGARAATGYGEHVAGELAAELAARGVTIVSGAAYGIDGVAHRAALSAGGPTVALLAGGLDRPYPAGHADLLDRIARAGTVVSEVPCTSVPTKWRFLARNRLIAALSDATVVVEAGRRSGTLNTAHHAADLGRPLGAVPGPVTSAASVGCHTLLRGPIAQCVTGVDDVLELIGRRRPEADDAAAPRTDDRTRVLDALSNRGGRGADDVARRSGMSVRDAESVLGLLAIDGTVARVDGGWRLVRTTVSTGASAGLRG